MENLNLFTDITRNRHKGNAESRDAHKRIVHRKAGDQQKILDYLKTHEATSKEIARDLGMGYTTVSARLSELKVMFLIEQTGERREGAAVLRALRTE